MILKQWIIEITGAVSASMGAVGAALAEFGLCPCILAPVFSFAGAATVIIGLLTKYKVYLLVLGIALLIFSLFMHRSRKECRIYSKRNI